MKFFRKDIVKIKELIIDTGVIDDSPPMYSPFHRSKADLYLYHSEYFKHGITSVACIASSSFGDDDDDEKDEDEDEVKMTTTTCGVWEMKNEGKAASYRVPDGS